jgi:hypothetical protein
LVHRVRRDDGLPLPLLFLVAASLGILALAAFPLLAFVGRFPGEELGSLALVSGALVRTLL